jgi:hypothetical protein
VVALADGHIADYRADGLVQRLPGGEVLRS